MWLHGQMECSGWGYVGDGVCCVKLCERAECCGWGCVGGWNVVGVVVWAAVVFLGRSGECGCVGAGGTC